jgi:hypothetical protein
MDRPAIRVMVKMNRTGSETNQSKHTNDLQRTLFALFLRWMSGRGAWAAVTASSSLSDSDGIKRSHLSLMASSAVISLVSSSAVISLSPTASSAVISLRRHQAQSYLSDGVKRSHLSLVSSSAVISLRRHQAQSSLSDGIKRSHLSLSDGIKRSHLSPPASSAVISL